MKLKNKLTIITAASMLAFVGAGFAAWTFNNSMEQEQKAGTYVTSAIRANNVALSVSGNTTVYLVLDQAKPYWSTAVGNGSKPVELADGKITVTPSYELTNNNDGASWTWTLTSAIDVDKAIAMYVKVTDFDTTPKTGKITAAGDEGISPVNYDLPALDYTASKPSTYAEYTKMLAAVGSSVITFTFNCTFAEN